jgi:uncharacterized Zn finger protein
MQCDCGGSTESEHQVVREKKIVAKYQKCPACGRIKLTWGAFPATETEEVK